MKRKAAQTTSAIAVSERHPQWAHAHFCAHQRRELAAQSVTWVLLGSWLIIAGATLWGMACAERLHRAAAVHMPAVPEAAMVLEYGIWHPPLRAQSASERDGWVRRTW